MKTRNSPLRFGKLSALLLSLVAMAPVCSRAGGVVTSPTEANLRAALAGGGTVTFATSGTIYLTSVLSITNNTLMDASGYAITLSGSNATQVFFVNTNVQFTLNNLTVANGLTNQGAGMYNSGGTVTMSNVTFSANRTVGTNGLNTSATQYNATSGESVYGAAICNFGSLTLVACRFWANTCLGGNGGNAYYAGGPTYPEGGNGGDAVGGAIYSTGPAAITNCVFLANSALSGSYGPGEYGSSDNGYNGNAFGGGFWNQGGTVAGSNCSFILNSASTGGLVTQGGGLGNATGTMSIVGAIVVSNSITGSAAFPGNPAFFAGVGAQGAGIYHGGGTLTLSGCLILANTASGTSESYKYGHIDGAPGQGGGLFSAGTAFVSNCTFESNNAAGGGSGAGLGNSATGGPGEGGGVCNTGMLYLSGCTLAGNAATGGASHYQSGSGGPAYGGGAFNNGSGLFVINSTIVNNLASGGAGAATPGFPQMTGPGGNSYGGGVYNNSTNGSIILTNCTLSGNAAIGGPGGIFGGSSSPNGVGYGGNIAQAGVVELIETIVNAGVSNNAYGTVTDLGYNISSDSSCAFSAPGSLNNTDPKLQPLANNGGPTLTMALWPGSPAIDAGISLPGITTDQRGVARPYGPAPDVGAYEWNGAPVYHNNFSLTSLSRTNGWWYFSGVGPTNQSFRVLVSSNFAGWIGLSTNNTGPFGAYVVQDPSASSPVRFYKTVSP